ncbi:MAG TPA: MOSC N-terminal beta barrel domain-containing protein [Acidimicrobiales bacterium]|nr:MOSC N-terminal beta barrel domain-containing protein [Acidimicrobiales bacterium]
MRISALWRYPVKSLQGEDLAEATVDADGLRGDRLYGIRDLATDRILTARREPRLLLAAAALDENGPPEISLPDGTRCTSGGSGTDIALTRWLGRAVDLVEASAVPAANAEYFADATDDTSAAIEWTMPTGRFVDALPLLVLTTASLRAAAAVYPDGHWDIRRFRPNLVVDADGDGWLEDDWCGRTIRVGEVEIIPRQPCVRCTMVTRPQPGLSRDLEIYKTLARRHGGTFGVWSTVRVQGTVHIGDPVDVIG